VANFLGHPVDQGFPTCGGRHPLSVSDANLGVSDRIVSGKYSKN